MFIKRCSKTVKGQKYVHHMLVETVMTPKGPRHRSICSLGDLEPGPPDKWLELAQRVQRSLSGQLPVGQDPLIAAIVEKAQAAIPPGIDQAATAEVVLDSLELSEACQAGPVHVGHQMWVKLGMDDVLKQAGLKAQARRLTEVLVLNRLCEPSSEHAISNWAKRTALADILTERMPVLNDTALYRNLDKLHPQRATIEHLLYERQRQMFQLAGTLFLYDLTSTYFEGSCAKNPKAKHGYSRDKRSDCRQVVLGLILDRDRFSVGHEVFDGNRTDATTLGDMLAILDKRTGKTYSDEQLLLPDAPRPLVVMDRGLASKENRETITQRGYSYLVACRASEVTEFAAEFENEEGWRELIRKTSAKNRYQHKTRVMIKTFSQCDEQYVLCRSDGRIEKDKAIRQRAEGALAADLEKLKKRLVTGKLKDTNKIHQALGRLKERHSRVARYYDITVPEQPSGLAWEHNQQREQAGRLDGAYVLRTKRKDLSDDEMWRTYMLLTTVEAAFGDMKGTLDLRPVYHQLTHRVETHLFICVLAYQLLVTIERLLAEAGIYESWATIRNELSTHQVNSASLTTTSGDRLTKRIATTPNDRQKQIYAALHIPDQPLPHTHVWCRNNPDAGAQSLTTPAPDVHPPDIAL